MKLTLPLARSAMPVVGIAVAALLVAAATAVAAPAIHAHRGGSVLDGVPTYPENTLPAFANAAQRGWVIELDAKLTSDDVPVVIHDATLERTTACTGQVRQHSLAQLAGCPSDVLGSPGSGLPWQQTSTTAPIPTLADALALARATGARVNLEIKNQPTDPDFDPTPLFASRVMDAVVASGIPAADVIVQSFWPANLEVARLRLPGVETSLLTLAELNGGGPAYAAALGHEWVSPAWPVSADYVAQAHLLGLRVVPFTLDRAADVQAAAQAGVDAIITDDPVMAERALGLAP